MFFSKILSLTILVATVAANTHDSCTCVFGASYNPALTAAACSYYDAADFKWGRSSYNSTTGRCVGTNGGQIAGNEWNEECKTAAQHIAFACPENKGTCYAIVDETHGSC